jgi:hypothetical protein
MKTRSILRLSALGLGGLLVALPATPARAAAPATAAEAQAKADHYWQQADRYRSLGGVGYASGIVQRAEDDAARYDALAAALAPSRTITIRSSEGERYGELAARYRALGGVGYKTGLVQWAEARQQHYQSPSFQSPYMTIVPGPVEKPACLFSSKPVVQWLACSHD